MFFACQGPRRGFRREWGEDELFTGIGVALHPEQSAFQRVPSARRVEQMEMALAEVLRNQSSENQVGSRN